MLLKIILELQEIQETLNCPTGPNQPKPAQISDSFQRRTLLEGLCYLPSESILQLFSLHMTIFSVARRAQASSDF